MNESAGVVRFDDPLPAFDSVVSYVTATIGRIGDDQWDDPTPCEEWDVRYLVGHLAFVNERYHAVAAGDENPPERQLDYSDPASAFTTWASAARAEFVKPDFLTEVIPTPIGEQPGAVVVQHVVNELTVHAWDLTRALGADTDFLPELAAEVEASWRAVYALLGNPPRSGDTVAEVAEVPRGASAADRMAAFMGRRV
ncbi:uncharacterized protein (TIGR03086 family) [Stackebrandtia albiflava]|uniref:Uncharacterized protein (TIGR03086 family) n=1 Tax=Stackebrandtia albiflava TaxID=406432 RepID=A0A562URA6_9ACTN|nr:TIGR03086 family metal-binding protein [Stackebrandtia albiflava]TWJ08149.1 uncharacterized protein (TIGR03086 family) [Stackebrandtia albiflava]